MHTRPLKSSPPRLQTEGRRRESAIACTRVSSPLQGKSGFKSGLGLEAQQAALHGGAAIWRPSIAFERARAAMLVIRGRAVVEVAGDDTSNSAGRRYAIFESLIVDISPLFDLAASTNAVDLAVDVRVFFIKTPLRGGCGNIGGARLAVAYRCRPRSG
jgi:hypothetical protein